MITVKGYVIDKILPKAYIAIKVENHCKRKVDSTEANGAGSLKNNQNERTTWQVMAEEPKRKHSRHKKTLYVVVENCLIFKKSTANNILTHYTSKVLRSISDTNIKLHQQIAGYFEVTSNARNTFSRHYTQAVFNFIQFCSIRPLSMHQTTTSC